MAADYALPRPLGRRCREAHDDDEVHRLHIIGDIPGREERGSAVQDAEFTIEKADDGGACGSKAELKLSAAYNNFETPRKNARSIFRTSRNVWTL